MFLERSLVKAFRREPVVILVSTAAEESLNPGGEGSENREPGVAAGREIAALAGSSVRLQEEESRILANRSCVERLKYQM